MEKELCWDFDQNCFSFNMYEYFFNGVFSSIFTVKLIIIKWINNILPTACNCQTPIIETLPIRICESLYIVSIIEIIKSEKYLTSNWPALKKSASNEYQHEDNTPRYKWPLSSYYYNVGAAYQLSSYFFIYVNWC